MENKYNELYNYISLNEQVLEKYIKINHENKNNLILIKSMIENKLTKEAINYINEIIGESNICVDEFKNIKSSTFKSFLKAKLGNLAKEQIHLNIDISNEVKKLDIDEIIPKNRFNDFYSMLGIILDNAIESTFNCYNKVISINIYLDNNQYIISISNTFNGHIDLDKISKIGYSTKGKNRGFGLSILNDILNKSSVFELKREVIQNVFNCELKINMKERK